MSFDTDLVAQLPRLRRNAFYFTRDKDAADDLVQETCARALYYRSYFKDGTNLAAWLSVILRNEFFSNKRRARSEARAVDALNAPTFQPDAQEANVELKEFMVACEKLSDVHKAVIPFMVQGYNERQAAAALGIELGTAKSRFSRARSELRRRAA